MISIKSLLSCSDWKRKNLELYYQYTFDQYLKKFMKEAIVGFLVFGLVLKVFVEVYLDLIKYLSKSLFDSLRL